MNVMREDMLQYRNRGRPIRRGGGRGAGFTRSQSLPVRQQTPLGGRISYATPRHPPQLPLNTQAAASRLNIDLPGFSGFRKQQVLTSSGSGSRPRTTSSELRTPRSVTTSTSDANSMCIVALTEGRGQARGEVGIAAMDVNYPHLILCQISDSQSYVNTLTKINVLNPVEILIPNTFCEGQMPNKLYTQLKEAFPTVTMTSVLRRNFKDTVGLRQIQQLCASEYSSVIIVVSQKFYALASAAALLKYIEFFRNILFSPKSLKVEYQGSQNTTVIGVKTAQLLELVSSLRGSSAQYSLMGILNHCLTNAGTRLLRANILEPPCVADIINTRLDCVQEMVETPELLSTLQSILPKFCDVGHLLSLCMHMPQQDNLQVAETQMKYTLLLKTILEVLPSLKQALQECKSKFLCTAREVIADENYQKIHMKMLTVIHDDARTARGAAASQIQRNFAVKAGISDILDLARQTYSEIINDISDLVGKLADKYSLPLRVNYNGNWGYHIQLSQGKNQIKESDLPPEFVQVHKNRSTLSFTTQGLIEADRRSKECLKEITSLSNVVICALLTEIRQDIGSLFKLCEVIAELDMLASFAVLSSLSTYVRPEFDTILDIEQSRHPILDIVSQREPVPNNVYASVDYNCHIITGPNMSGKSIYIRQIALLQILAQVGCYVPAKKATFRLTDHIFSRLSFDDSIECNASTFVLETKEFQYIKQTVTPKSLIIIDELCRGTSCEEGTAIAWVIVEELLQEEAFIFLTTHFLYLTKLQEIYCNVTNNHFEVLEECTESGRDKLVYTHRLLPGVTQIENYGLRLAESLAFPESVVNTAKRLAQKLSLQRKAFNSTSIADSEMHNCYKLASILEREGEETLTPERKEEIRKMFSMIKIDKISDNTGAHNKDDHVQQRTEERTSNNEQPQATVFLNEEEIRSTENIAVIGDNVQEEATDEACILSDLTKHTEEEEFSIALSLDQEKENLRSGKHKETTSTKSVFHETAYTKSRVENRSAEDEPMEVEYNTNGITHPTPFVTLPEETPEHYSFQTILDAISSQNESQSCKK